MCKYCNIKNCPILNKTECIVNKLWTREEVAKETVKEAERYLATLRRGWLT